MTEMSLCGVGTLALASTKRIRLDLANVPGMRVIEVFCREPGGVSIGTIEPERERATLQLLSEDFDRLRSTLLDREPNDFDLSLNVDGVDVTEFSLSSLRFEFTLFRAPTRVESMEPSSPLR